MTREQNELLDLAESLAAAVLDGDPEAAQLRLAACSPPRPATSGKGTDMCETCGHEPAHDNDDSGCACGCHYSAEHHARIHAKLAVYRATGVYPTDQQMEEARHGA